MTHNSLLPPDQYGHLPRMHYDALWKTSPTTRADLVAWCVAQRNEDKVSIALRGSAMVTMTAAMTKKAALSRVGDLPAAQLGAIEAAADELHAIVREYGYDPTGVEKFKQSCMDVIMQKIGPLTYDLSPEGETLAGMPSSLESLRKLIGMAAVATTLASALTGHTPAQTTLNALLLAYDESDNPEFKTLLSQAAAKLKQTIDRQREA